MIRALRMMVRSLVPDAITVYKTFSALLCQHISKGTQHLQLLTLPDAIVYTKKKTAQNHKQSIYDCNWRELLSLSRHATFSNIQIIGALSLVNS